MKQWALYYVPHTLDINKGSLFGDCGVIQQHQFGSALTCVFTVDHTSVEDFLHGSFSLLD